MSHPTGFYDPNAGRYRGSDPEAAKAFRELQKQMQRLRPDVLFKIVGYHFSGGAYSVVALDGLTNVSGANTTTLQFGIPSGDPLLAVNTLERIGHWVPLGMVVAGVRRLNTDGTDTIFFQLSRSDVSGSNGLPGGGTTVITGPGPGDGGDPGGGPGGGPGGDPGGGSGGASCPMLCTGCQRSFTVTIAGTPVEDGENGTYRVFLQTMNGADFECAWSTDNSSYGANITCYGGRWYVQTFRHGWGKDNVTGCPETGSYTGPVGTCRVS